MTRRRALGLAALAAACSTAAVEQPRRGCDEDADCRTGEQCSDRFCYASELPPREALALDVRSEFSSPQFRIELLGEDGAVARVLDRTPNRFYVSLLNQGDELPGVRDRLVLSLLERRMLLSPKEQMNMEPDVVEIPGEIRLVQPSRLGRGPLVAAGLRYPVVDPVTGEQAFEPEVVQTWPRYDSSDARGQLPLLAEVTARDDVPDEQDPMPTKLYGRGIVYRQLVRKNVEGASTQVFAIPDLRECHRKVASELRFPDGAPAPLDPPVKVSVSMRHAGRPAPDPDDPQPHCDPTPPEGTPATCSTATLLPQSSSECESDLQCAAPYRCYELPNSATKRCGCRADAECPGGQVCNLERQQCALPLTDLQAIRPLDVDLLDFAPVQAWVYTYCEDAPTLPQRTMEFIVTATPDASLGLPRLSYRVVSDFFYDDGELPTTTMPALCLPSWQPAQPIALTIGGPPAEIYRDSRDRGWVCCETACIDPTDDNPTVVDGTCSIKASIATTGSFKIPDPNTWIDAGCMPLYGADAEGNVRSTYNKGDCEGAGCTVNLSPGVAGGEGKTYELQIEPPVGSIFRSAKVPLTVQQSTTGLPIELGYRVLLRGKIKGGACTDGETDGDGCGSDNAEVLAERVTRGEDKSTLLGPYFYTARTLSDDGEYVLPVNPGVYLLTALPEISVSGSATGPAPIVVVDLRETSPLVREENGILVADAPELTLQPGVSYTIELDEFPSSTRVIPLDVTTWAGLAMDGVPLDLGAPETCAPSEACLIRRLRPGNSPLLLTQDQFVTYVARATPAPAAE